MYGTLGLFARLGLYCEADVKIKMSDIPLKNVGDNEPLIAHKYNKFDDGIFALMGGIHYALAALQKLYTQQHDVDWILHNDLKSFYSDDLYFTNIRYYAYATFGDREYCPDTQSYLDLIFLGTKGECFSARLYIKFRDELRVDFRHSVYASIDTGQLVRFIEDYVWNIRGYGVYEKPVHHHVLSALKATKVLLSPRILTIIRSLELMYREQRCRRSTRRKYRKR